MFVHCQWSIGQKKAVAKWIAMRWDVGTRHTASNVCYLIHFIGIFLCRWCCHRCSIVYNYTIATESSIVIILIFIYSVGAERCVAMIALDNGNYNKIHSIVLKNAREPKDEAETVQMISTDSSELCEIFYERCNFNVSLDIVRDFVFVKIPVFGQNSVSPFSFEWQSRWMNGNLIVSNRVVDIYLLVVSIWFNGIRIIWRHLPY